MQGSYLETIHLSPPAPPDQPADQVIVHLYGVTAWEGTPTNRQPHEHSVIGWFSLAEATQLPLADSGYPALFERYLTWSQEG